MMLTTWLKLYVIALVMAASAAPATFWPEAKTSQRGFGGRTTQSAHPERTAERQAVEAFLDTALPRQMEDEHIAGAAVAVVQNGQLLSARGYGSADVEQGRPVNVERTIFLTGSTGKLFTWTAVMQLAEQGKLNLGADVNTYLDFQIPATYPEPITLKHLLSHSAGFEDSAFIYARTPAELPPLGEYLARNIPARIRAPGVLAAYSNYGTALAGYIVERVAGEPFARYIADHIFAPLQMHHSSFEQPLPPTLAAELTRSYAYTREGFQRIRDKFIRTPPTGASATTVTDMANFMIAHLNDGRFGTDRILRQETAQQMHTRLWTADPHVNGFAYGFAETTLNGQRILRHEGEVPGNGCSALMLLPEHRTGLYVAYNGMCDTTTGTRFWHAFLDAFYPAPTTATSQAASYAAADGVQWAGSYRSTRRSVTSFSKLMVLFGGSYGDITVTVEEDGALRTRGLGPQPLRWVQVEPGTFQPADDNRTTYGRLLFSGGADGQGRVLLIENVPYRAYEQVAWYQSTGFSMALLAVCAAICLSVLALAASGTWLRRRNLPAFRPGTALRRARGLLTLADTLYLLFATGLSVLAIDAITYGVTSAVVGLFALPVVATVLVVASLIFAIRGWHDTAWGGVIGRVHYGGVVLAAVAMASWLYAWNLLGFRF
jgi:CubicO group peptidase (beta-lactamase class C family)